MPHPAAILASGLVVLVAATAAHADAPACELVDRPIPFGEDRERLTIEYRRAHQDPAAADSTITPTMVVLHYTGGHSAAATIRYFTPARIEPGRPQLARAGALNVSAHFVVDRDGTVYRLLPETRMARHAIGLNHLAIGIENVGDGRRWPLTDAQVKANAALIRWLAARYPITHLVGHQESRLLEGTPLFVERDPRYRNRKGDPGTAFLAKVRAAVADLGLQGPPAPPTPRTTAHPQPKRKP